MTVDPRSPREEEGHFTYFGDSIYLKPAGERGVSGDMMGGEGGNENMQNEIL